MLMKKVVNGQCTGCAACAAICPIGAIYLKENKNGFREPVIIKEKCINCDLCEKVCNENIEYKETKRVYIAKHKNVYVHKDSQSGGAFTAISDYILSQEGVVYGAIFNNEFEVVHSRSTQSETRDKMRGSKYIQSNIDTVYKEIENDLNCNRKVLFVGTGCQVAGVLRYFKKRKVDLLNLYTVDILCHGVPSLFIWRDTLRYLQKKYGANISSIDLKEVEERSRPVINIKLGNTEITDFLYRKLYYSNLALRKSCYSCQYNKILRVGDITIGDAWGIEKKNPLFNDKRGVSLIMINSNKGIEIEYSILQNMTTEIVNINDYLQECLVSPAKAKRDPAIFWHDYHSKKFSYIIDKYAKHHLLLNITYIIGRIYQKITGVKK